MSSPWLEIVLPVRDPGSKLLETGASLAAQTERGFCVVLSDNHSSKGQEVVAQFLREMAAASIPVRSVKPPYALGRVQHWNWAHAEGHAEWLKPLFVGDLLLPSYVERLRQRTEARPQAQVVRCLFQTRRPDGVTVSFTPFTETSLTPSEFLQYYPVGGNWLGGPINFAYRRAAWQAVGGYSPQLPACADLRLNALLSLRHGLEVVHEELAVFQLHDQRFSHAITRRRVNGCFELWLILRQLRNYATTAKLPWPKNGIFRSLFKQLKIDYWHPFKKKIKTILGIK